MISLSIIVLIVIMIVFTYNVIDVNKWCTAFLFLEIWAEAIETTLISFIFFRRFFNEFEFDAVLNIMFVFMTSMTFHFRKIYEIFIFKFFDFFVRNLVFLTLSFTIFASFFSIFRFVSTDRTLHIVIFIDVIDIWLLIKKLTFFDFVRIIITNFSFIEENLCVL